MTPVTPSFYTGDYCGKAVSAADFPRLSLRAHEILRRDTAGRIDGTLRETVLYAVQMCLCALVELLAENDKMHTESGALVKESVGSWSRTYRGADASVRTQIRAAEERYLADTGLLYRGGRYADV
ncbi:MAG: hypothetical protein RSB47_03060 [Ruthenibacterium sp.]